MNHKTHNESPERFYAHSHATHCKHLAKLGHHKHGKHPGMIPLPTLEQEWTGVMDLPDGDFGM